MTTQTTDTSVVFEADITYNHMKYTNKISTSKNLEYEFSTDGTSYIVTGIGTCKDLDIIIPRIYNGLPAVTSIRDYAFSNCDSLTSVVLLEGLKNIGRYAFEGRDSLVNVTIPESVIHIKGWF